MSTEDSPTRGAASKQQHSFQEDSEGFLVGSNSAELRAFSQFEPPAFMVWLHEKFVAPALRDDMSFKTRLQVSFTLIPSFGVLLMVGLGCYWLSVSLTEPSVEDPVMEGGRQGYPMFLGCSLLVVIGGGLFFSTALRTFFTGKFHEWQLFIAPCFAAPTTVMAIITFVSAAAIISTAIPLFICVIIFTLAADYPIFSTLMISLLGLISSFAFSNTMMMMSANFSGFNETTVRGAREMPQSLRIDGWKGVYEMAGGWWLGSPAPRAGGMAERWILWLVSFVFFVSMPFFLALLRGEMSRVARAQLANTESGRNMATALRSLDIASLEHAAEQLKQLPFRDEGLVGHLRQMLADVSIFGRFVPRDIIAAIRDEGENPEETGIEQREAVVVLVCELCNVCQLIDIIDDGAALEALFCGITTRVEEIVRQHGGTVVDSGGCQFRAVWGAPQRLQNKHAGVLSVLAALHLAHMLREEFVPGVEKKFNLSGLRFRMGISKGTALVGNIGVGGRSRSRQQRTSPGCRYTVVGGEAERVAHIAAVLGAQAENTSIIATRDVLLDERGTHDVSVAADLVTFACREVSRFIHDLYPTRVFTAVQICGVCDGRGDLIRETTRRASPGDAVERQQMEGKMLSMHFLKASLLPSSSSGHRSRGAGGGARSASATSSGSDSDTASDTTFGSADFAGSSGSSGSPSSASLSLDNSEDDDDDNHGGGAGGSSSGATGSSSSAAAGPFDSDRMALLGGGGLRQRKRVVTFKDDNPVDATLSSGRRGSSASCLEGPSPTQLEDETNYLVARQNDIYRATIAASVGELRKHCYVDDAAADVLLSLTGVQKGFYRRDRRLINEALLLCQHAVIRPMQLAERSLPPEFRHKVSVSPHSSPATKRVLAQVTVNRESVHELYKGLKVLRKKVMAGLQVRSVFVATLERQTTP